MTYTVEILPIARKQLSKIDRKVRYRITEAIRSLSADPRPVGSKKLIGRTAWRIRVGSYRVIYEIADDRLIVLVVTVGHRREIYR